jgi:hypothetical protein
MLIIFKLPMYVAFLAIQCSTCRVCFLYILKQKPGCRLRETSLSRIQLSLNNVEPRFRISNEVQLVQYILMVKRP